LLPFSLILVILLEVSTRIFLPQQLIKYDSFYVADETGLGRVPAPNLDFIINTGERDAHYITDERGFRVQSHATSTATPDKRLLMIGDSYLMALQANYEQTTGGLLETRLSEALQQSVVVENSGSAGFSINHYRILLENLLEDNEYDVVLVFLNPSNDLVPEPMDYYEPSPVEERHLRLPAALTASELKNAVLYPINDWFESNSHLFVLGKSRMRTVLAQLGLTGYYFPWALEKQYESREHWEVTARQMGAMERLAEEHDTRLLFILIPMATQIDSSYITWYQQAFNVPADTIDLTQPQRILGEYATAYNYELLIPHETFVMAARERILYGEIDPHFSPVGHEVMATFLEPILTSYLQTQSD
jgi:hypothetical protein